jgi:hypothetical protein
MVTVLSEQSLIDIAVQSTGSVESLFELALKNDSSVTEALVPGAGIEVGGASSNKQVTAYYKAKGLKPATYSSREAESLSGIGNMAIEINFIVS